MMRYRLLILFLAVSLIFSCKNTTEREHPESTNLRVEVVPFEKDLFTVNPDSLEYEIPKLKSRYGVFFNLFTEGVIGIGSSDDNGFVGLLRSFVTDRMVRESHSKVEAVFPNLTELNRQLTNGFNRFNQHFPERPIPTVYSFISGFNQSIVLADSLLGIGLDRYLGRDCDYYVRLGIPKYVSYNMHPAKIPSDCIRIWGLGEFPFNDSIDNLANNLVYEGMLLYFTRTMLPEQPDSLILGFTPNEMEWCAQNEKPMWNYLVENKLLFTTDSFLINKLINPAPFTSGFPQESPGRGVVWLGYRIVQSYMRNNDTISIHALMNTRDYQKLLTGSRYKP